MCRAHLVWLSVVVIACSTERTGVAEGNHFPASELLGAADWNGNRRVDRPEVGDLSLARVVAMPAPRAAKWVVVHVVYAWCQFCATETEIEASWVTSASGTVRVMQVLVENATGDAPTQDDLWSWMARSHSLAQGPLPTGIERQPHLRKLVKEPTFFLVEAKPPVRIIRRETGPRGFARLRTWVEDAEEKGVR
jgi:hypothetical protein